MCVVSMIGDHYRDKWRPRNPPEWPYWPVTDGPADAPPVLSPPVSREEYEKLKKEVEEMKSLLKRAKAYDDANHESECEVDEKMALLRRVAAAVGVSLDDVLGAPTSTAKGVES